MGRQARAALRRRLARWLRTAIAFTVTLAAIIAVVFVAIASQGRVGVKADAPLPIAPAGGTVSMAEAAQLLSFASEDSELGEVIFPNRRARRVALFQEGAAESVAFFVEAVSRTRARDPNLTEALALLSAPRADVAGDEGARVYARARDALRRFNTRAPIERSPKALAALARAAAAACAAHEEALRDAAVRGRFGPADRGAEAAFFRARGAAFGWARLLAAYLRDLPGADAEPLRAPLADMLTPLRAAAAFEPQVLFNAPRGVVAANHVERLATAMAAAAAAGRRLDRAIAP